METSINTTYMVTWIAGKPTNTGRSDYFRVYEFNNKNGVIKDVSTTMAMEMKMRYNNSFYALTITGYGYSKKDSVMEDVKEWQKRARHTMDDVAIVSC